MYPIKAILPIYHQSGVNVRIKTISGLSGVGRLWVVQRWNDRGGWFDWSICTTLREAEEDYITSLKQDGCDRNTRIIRIEKSIKKESRHANSIE